MLYLDVGVDGNAGQSEPTFNKENIIKDVPLFTQIDFQTNNFVINSCFNIAYIVPVGSTKEKFAITISCRTISHEGHDYTCYEIEIIYTSGNNFTLNALLMDDDNNPNNEYYYMYAIKYNSGTRTEYFTNNTYTGVSGGTSMTPTYNSGS